MSSTRREGDRKIHVVALGEEKLPAYDRVHRSEYFGAKRRTTRSLARRHGTGSAESTCVLLVKKSPKSSGIRGSCSSESGEEFPYDTLILATGSAAFVLLVPRRRKKGRLR